MRRIITAFADPFDPGCTRFMPATSGGRRSSFYYDKVKSCKMPDDTRLEI